MDNFINESQKFTPKQTLVFGSSSNAKLNIIKKFKIFPDIIINPDIDESRIKHETPMNLSKRLALQKGIITLKKVIEQFHAQQNKGIENISSDNKFNNNTHNLLSDIFILSFDSVVSVGTRVLEKSSTKEIMKDNLELLSGKSHRVLSGFNIMKVELKNLDKLLDLCCNLFNEFETIKILEPKLGLTKLNSIINNLKYIHQGIKIINKCIVTQVKFKRLDEKEIERYISINEASFHYSVYQSENYGMRFIKSINGSTSGLQGLPLCEVINSLESIGYRII